MTKDFIAKHPDLKQQVLSGELKKYTKLSEHGIIQEFWEYNDKGQLVDHTKIAKAQQKLELEKEKAMKLRMKMLREKALEAKAVKQDE